MRVLRRPALRGHQRVPAVVLHPHERGVPQLARLRAADRHQDDRPVGDVATLVRRPRLEDLLGLLAHPALGTDQAFTCQRHGRIPTSVVGARSPHSLAALGRGRARAVTLIRSEARRRLPSGRRDGGAEGERTVGATPPRVMTIAGTDSGGGAGVAADLRAFAACGVHGCVAVTAVTVQNTVGVTGVHTVPPETVAAQIEAVATDIGLDAVKTGMLATTRDHPGDRAGVRPDRDRRRRPDAAGRRPGRGVHARRPAARRQRARRLPHRPVPARHRRHAEPRRGAPAGRPRRARPGRAVRGGDAAARARAAARAGQGRAPARTTPTSASTCTTTAARSPSCPGPGSRPATPTAAATPWPRPLASGLARGLPVDEAIALAKRFVVEAVRHSYPLGAGHGPVSPLWAIRPWWRDLV